ncbi:MAG: hypothetical protein V5A36_08450 [Natronomonas sp.]
MTADTPGDRKQFFVRRIIESRQASESVVFEAEGATVEYEDRTLRVELSSDERDRLDESLEAYHVFKIKQPETRKADESIVYLSAVTDAKHAADFVEVLFRDVYELSEEYELQ